MSCPGRPKIEPTRQTLPAHGRRRSRLLRAGVLGCLVLVVCGCSEPGELDHVYGKRRGPAANSVNGTSVLAAMFEESGFVTHTWRYLSPRLRGYDVIVWAPDQFTPPSEETRQFFEDWLQGEPDSNEAGKTLIYIGRDFDGLSVYWESVLPEAPPDQQLETMRRLAESRAEYEQQRLEIPQEECAGWFTLHRDNPKRKATQLSGAWSQGLVAAEANITTRAVLAIPTEPDLKTFWDDVPPPIFQQPDFEPLLQDGDRMLVSRVTKPAWPNSQIIVVTNGSFLLNLPLVNHQHRKLAGKLIAECGSAQQVAFLESGPAGPSLVAYDPTPTNTQARRRRTVLAAHWLFLGLLYCFSVFPIFGRPKSIEADADADFGQHIDALSALLERTRDTNYARRQVEQYREAVRRETGVRTDLQIGKAIDDSQRAGTHHPQKKV